MMEPARPGRPTPNQIHQLLEPIKPGRVRQQQGQSYLAGWDVSAHLTRMFGFCGWEKQILALDLVGEDTRDKGGRPGWWVTYRCHLRLRLFDRDGRVMWENDDVATGSAANQPDYGDAHDLACKNAVTYALKRCAKDLGDQFGLSLYNGGSTDPLVRKLVDDEEASS